ncbi:hypothetical protein BDW74DRAFT_184090 [Aspergillus multicolor]|uniref:uncharacterized protein n=1 Tax=Aspergillus multicolor TaxID=41759 RepID=UPI003CCD299F
MLVHQDRRKDDYMSALEEDSDAEFETIQQRGYRRKAVELIEELTRHLESKNIRHYWICCGYRILEKKWQIYIGVFTPKMADRERVSVKLEIIAKFLGGRPDRDLTVDRFGKSPFRLMLLWMRPKGWEFMTRLEVMDGIPYTVERGEESECGHPSVLTHAGGVDDGSKRSSGFFSKVLATVSGSSSGDREAVPFEGTRFMTLDEVLGRMKEQSAGELLDHPNEGGSDEESPPAYSMHQ